MANDGSVIIGTKVDDTGFKQGLDSLGSLAGKGLKALGTGAITAIGAGAGAVIAFGKASVDAGISFDSAMSQVASTMGVTKDEISDLEAFAKQMGSETAFSASQAAQALNYMALAGYDSEKSMSMLPTVLNLASAGGMELAQASDMVTDAQSALGLSMEETTELVDKMAKASSKSNTSVAQLGDAILTIGGTAKNLAGGTTELSTALGILADNGIKGSEGGTALRNIILSLSSPTKDASEELEKLGVSVFDADGKMRPLNETFGDLEKALGDLSQQDRTKALSNIFNKVDLKSANALLATSAQRWEELSGAIDNAQGSAKKMADTQLDNLAGDITLFKSALEGAELTLSSQLTPAIRRFVQFGTNEIGKLDKAFQKGGISGLAKQFGKSLSEAVKMVSKYIPDIISAGAQLAGEFISSIYNYIMKNFDRFVRQGGQFIENFAKGAEKTIPEVMTAIGDLIGKTIANVPKLIEYGLKLISSIASGILQGIPSLASGIYEGLKGAVSKPLGDDTVEAMASLQELEDYIAGIKDKQAELTQAEDEWALKAEMAQPWIDIYDSLYKKTNLSVEEQAKLQTAVETLNGLFPELGLQIDEETGKWNLNTEEIRKNIEALKDRALAEVYAEKAKELLKDIVELEGKRTEAVKNRNKEKAIYDEETVKVRDLRGVYDDLVGAQDKGLRKLEEMPQSVKDWATANGILEESQWNASEASAELLAQMGQHQDKADDAKQAMAKYTEEANKAQTEIRNLTSTVEDYFKKSAEYKNEADKIGKAISDGVAGGITSRGASIAQAGRKVVNDALSDMKRLAQIHSPSQLFKKEIGENIGLGVVEGIEDSITPDAIADAVGFDSSLFNKIDTARSEEALRSAMLSDQAGIASSGSVAETQPVQTPRYVETTINIDGRETARVITPYVSKEIAWASL